MAQSHFLDRLNVWDPKKKAERRRIKFKVAVSYEILITNGKNHFLPSASMTILNDMKDNVNISLHLSKDPCDVRITGVKNNQAKVLVNDSSMITLDHEVSLCKYDLVRIVLKSKGETKVSFDVEGADELTRVD